LAYAFAITPCPYPEKHIVALNRLAAMANMPKTEELSTAFIAQLLRDRNTSQKALLVHRNLSTS
jgi:23S rRNA-/tRNA-specific pseudouridylate synthase